MHVSPASAPAMRGGPECVAVVSALAPVWASYPGLLLMANDPQERRNTGERADAFASMRCFVSCLRALASLQVTWRANLFVLYPRAVLRCARKLAPARYCAAECKISTFFFLCAVCVVQCLRTVLRSRARQRLPQCHCVAECALVPRRLQSTTRAPGDSGLHADTYTIHTYSTH
jgi:hypothetical protein